MNKLNYIAHLSLQSFFASVEQASHRSLAGKPVAVIDAHRSKVVSASPEAKSRGINKGMMLTAAIRQAPDVTYLTGAIDLYERFSEKFFRLVYSYTDQVEPLTLDQAYVCFHDCTWQKAKAKLSALMKETESVLGIPIRGGMAITKITAYLACRYGNRQLTVIKPGRERLFLNTLPLHALPSIGYRTAAILARYGIYSLRQLALAPDDLLTSEFGSGGTRLKAFAAGQDTRSIVPLFDQRSLTRSSDRRPPTMNIFEITQSAEQALARLVSACEDSAQRFGQLTVIVHTEKSQHSRALRLPRPCNTPSAVRPLMFKLLSALIRQEAVIQISLQATTLRTDPTTQTFFSRTLASLATIRQSFHYLYHQFGWRASVL